MCEPSSSFHRGSKIGLITKEREEEEEKLAVPSLDNVSCSLLFLSRTRERFFLSFSSLSPLIIADDDGKSCFSSGMEKKRKGPGPLLEKRLGECFDDTMYMCV